MLQKVKWLIANLEEMLCVFLLAVMGVVMFVNVISRYLLQFSFAFTEELVINFFVWLTLLGASAVFRKGSHIGFSMITDELPFKLRRLLLWLRAFLGGFLFSLLIYSAICQVKEEVSLGVISSGIGAPMWWYTIGMPVWSVFVITRIFEGAFLADRKMRRA